MYAVHQLYLDVAELVLHSIIIVAVSGVFVGTNSLFIIPPKTPAMKSVFSGNREE